MEGNSLIKNNIIIGIPCKNVLTLGLGYLVLPICIFFLTWLKWYIGIPVTVILVIGFISLLKGTYTNNVSIISIPIKHFLFILLFLALWVWTTGIGNFFVSAYDQPWRTAIFRDLVNYHWPVIYPETGNAMVYYLCYWMVPALIGKVLGWTAGNIALWLWTYLGVILIFLILLYVCKIKTIGGFWCVALILFGWSGLNIVGSVVTQILNMNLYEFSLGDYVVWLDKLWNGYSFNFSYRTNMNALENIYNQTTPVWIATLLAYDNKKNLNNFAFIGLCLLPFAPLPFLGLVIFLLSFFFKILKEKYTDIRKIICDIFSVQNVCSVITIFPVMLLFYFCNKTTDQSNGGGFMLLPLEYFDKTRIIGLILFWLLEFGILSFLIYRKYKHNYIFYIDFVILLICPLIEFGKRGGRDFCMNASMPALFILMCFTIIYINEEIINRILTFESLCVISVLIISCLSPVGRITTQLDAIGNQKTFPIVNDNVYTLSAKEYYTFENFLIPSPEATVFFKYLAKEIPEIAYEENLKWSMAYREEYHIPFCSGNFIISPKQDNSMCLFTDGISVFLEKGENVLNLLFLNDGGYGFLFNNPSVALDVPNGIVDDNGAIHVWQLNASSAQSFVLEEIDGHYMICYQDYALTYNSENNTLYLSQKTGYDNQQWTFTQKN